MQFLAAHRSLECVLLVSIIISFTVEFCSFRFNFNRSGGTNLEAILSGFCFCVRNHLFGSLSIYPWGHDPDQSPGRSWKQGSWERTFHECQSVRGVPRCAPSFAARSFACQRLRQNSRTIV